MILPLKPAKAKTLDEFKRENPFLTHQIFISEKQIIEFEKLLDTQSKEKGIDSFLAKNPEIFTAVLHNFHTGHHGTIVIPKQAIRSKIRLTDTKGLIPDFIIGGKNSDGWAWWIVEIKGVNQKIFSTTKQDIYFNNEINKGICQLLEYIDFCSEYQSSFRDQFKLTDFREPNGLLIAGLESELETDISRQKLKAAWNRVSKGKLEIRTYDFIRRVLRPMFENIHK